MSTDVHVSSEGGGTVPLSPGDPIRVTVRVGMDLRIDDGRYIGLYVNLHNGLGMEYAAGSGTTSVPGACIVAVERLVGPTEPPQEKADG